MMEFAAPTTDPENHCQENVPTSKKGRKSGRRLVKSIPNTRSHRQRVERRFEKPPKKDSNVGAGDFVAQAGVSLVGDDVRVAVEFKPVRPHWGNGLIVPRSRCRARVLEPIAAARYA